MLNLILIAERIKKHYGIKLKYQLYYNTIRPYIYSTYNSRLKLKTVKKWYHRKNSMITSSSIPITHHHQNFSSSLLSSKALNPNLFHTHHYHQTIKPFSLYHSSSSSQSNPYYLLTHHRNHHHHHNQTFITLPLIKSLLIPHHFAGIRSNISLSTICSTNGKSLNADFCTVSTRPFTLQ